MSTNTIEEIIQEFWEFNGLTKLRRMTEKGASDQTGENLKEDTKKKIVTKINNQLLSLRSAGTISPNS